MDDQLAPARVAKFLVAVNGNLAEPKIEFDEMVSEPGHKGRSYRVLTMPEDGPTVDPDTYLGCAALHEGSWWPEWQRWLAEHSAKRVAPPEMAQALCDAPGTYVLKRYTD